MNRTRSVVAVAALTALAAVVSTTGVDAATKKTTKKAAKKTTGKAAATTKAATATTVAAAPAAASAGVTAEGISADRCAANKKAGRITYLSGFDYAATASIVEMIVADAKGYFAKMCLDVDVKASFSTANYALVADNKAQFASAGSYTELLRNTPKEKKLPMVYNLGKTAIDTLMVRDEGKGSSILDLRGKTIGMKGDIPPSIVAMLNKNGLKRGVDYKDQLVEGFDPVAHFKLPIDALPGYKSNEPGQLERAGVAFRTFDPTRYGIPGSFGNIYTNEKFLKDNPTAAQDFVRAALKGYADAVANPDEAIKLAVDRINANKNPNYLSPVGEAFRWKTELKVVADNNPAGNPIGVIIPKLLQDQVDAYTEAGVFTAKPSIVGTYDADIAKGVYGPDGKVIWPAK